MIAVPKAELCELYKLLGMPEVELEPTLPGGNRILSPIIIAGWCVIWR